MEKDVYTKEIRKGNTVEINEYLEEKCGRISSNTLSILN